MKSLMKQNMLDANCPFRLMRTNKVSEYMSMLPDHYFLPNVMLTVFFVKHDRTTFKEVTFENRKGGRNSINLKKIVKIGMQSLRKYRIIGWWYGEVNFSQAWPANFAGLLAVSQGICRLRMAESHPSGCRPYCAVFP